MKLSYQLISAFARAYENGELTRDEAIRRALANTEPEDANVHAFLARRFYESDRTVAISRGEPAPLLDCWVLGVERNGADRSPQPRGLVLAGEAAAHVRRTAGALMRAVQRKASNLQEEGRPHEHFRIYGVLIARRAEGGWRFEIDHPRVEGES